MADRASDPIARAKAKLAEAKAMKEQHFAETRFQSGYTAAELVRIAETGKDLRGKKLDALDWQSLDGAWFEKFGEPLFGKGGTKATLPPIIDPAEHPIVTVPDDAMLRPKDVRRLFGMPSTTLKRWIREGTFPKPQKIVPGKRAIGWPARQLKEWWLGS